MCGGGFPARAAYQDFAAYFRTRRVLEASIEYRELLAENPFEGIRIVDIIREGMTGDDQRLQ